jgi:hypothetical protein
LYTKRHLYIKSTRATLVNLLYECVLVNLLNKYILIPCKFTL